MGKMGSGTCLHLHWENENWLSGTGNHKKKIGMGLRFGQKKRPVNEIWAKFGLENGIYTSPFKTVTESS